MPAEVERSTSGEERGVLRWGGIAGMLAGILFIVEAVVINGFVPPGQYLRFPDVRAAVAVGAAIEDVVVILWVAFLVALYRVLRRDSLAPAFFGIILGVLGWAVFLVGVGQTPTFVLISNLYHAPGATAAEQETLALIWPVARSIFNGIEITGGFFIVIGVIVLGVAMSKAPAFGKGFGGLSVVLGVLGVVGTSFFAYSSLGYALLVVPVVIIIPIILGWKMHSLSRTG